MKRTKLLALSLVIAVILMGAGYAYWQEDLTISNTVKTGDLNVVFEENENYGDDHDNDFPKDFDYVEVNIDRSQDGKSLTFNIDKLYPGAGGWMSFKVKNEGTVPAKIKEIIPTISSDHEILADELEYMVEEIRYYRQGALGEYSWEPLWQTPLQADDFSDFVDDLEYRLKYKQGYFQDNTEEVILEPGGYLEIRAARSGYNIEVPTSVDNDSVLTELADLTFDLGITFEQCE